MRWLLLFVMVGCTSKLGELHDLEQRAKQCGGVVGPCAMTIDVPPVVTCMSDALASGTLAEALWSDELTGRDYYIFTEGDHFHVYTEDYASSGDSEVKEELTCSGFQTTTTTACGEYIQVELTGC